MTWRLLIFISMVSLIAAEGVSQKQAPISAAPAQGMSAFEKETTRIEAGKLEVERLKATVEKQRAEAESLKAITERNGQKVEWVNAIGTILAVPVSLGVTAELV